MEDKNQQIVIQKDPQLPKAEDYFALREEGFSAIEELGNATWTDYNAHDPGITSLEVFCYALSELGYRTGLKIEDLLTDPTGLISFRQAFFTARNILTNAPLTENDFRKVLIDLERIQNGWLICKSCYCETQFYAECRDSVLAHAPLWRTDETRSGNDRHEHPVFTRGLYDVVLELEDDVELGNLNNRKVSFTQNINLPEENTQAQLTIEARFPNNWEVDFPERFQLFINTDSNTFLEEDADTYSITNVVLDRFSRDRVLDEAVSEASFIQGWRGIFFADFTITITNDNDGEDSFEISIPQVTLRFFSPKESLKRNIDLDQIREVILTDHSPGSIISKYREKLVIVNNAILEAKAALHEHRNVGEDYCSVSVVCIEDVAVCMDIELETDADIEWVMAQVYNQIELYFNPPVPFYTLQELVDESYPTEAIFEGPPLENGFIKDKDLEASKLSSYLYVSDLINLIMDLEGVIAVKNVLLNRYDQEGKPLSPSEPWKVSISAGCIPQLYVQASRILFYKNELPFLPRMAEVDAILAQLRGERDKPKIPLADNDFPVPLGQHRDLEAYYPLQYSYPDTYRIGAAGLPDSATDRRKAQAIQLKGYLMTYEQIVGDLIAQLSNAKELFSLDESIDQTYFQHYFDRLAPQPEIAGLPDLLNPGITEEALHLLTEQPELYHDRRNRFLDHLLARFGEQFREYALMLYSNEDRIAYSPDKLIKDKIRFLNDYPRISAQRGKAFNYKNEDRVCDIRNISGPVLRISRFLGIETLRAYFQISVVVNQELYEVSFILQDPDDNIFLESTAPLVTPSVLEANLQVYELIGDVMANCTEAGQYGVDGNGHPVLNNEAGDPIARLVGTTALTDVIDFSSQVLSKERVYLVEHLLLRPKFPGDALMSVCLDDDCQMCGEEDPYSFQVTYVMQGKLAPFSYDIDLRKFADRSIRKETPAHLLPKICWVGNDICLQYEDISIICEIRDLLTDQLTDPADEETQLMICDCANAIFTAFNNTIEQWTAENDPELLSTDQIQQDLTDIFSSAAPEGSLTCHDLLQDGYYTSLQSLIVSYFQSNLDCYQFNTFERYWCKWLEQNAAFDWATETYLLNRRVQRLIERHFTGTELPENDVICHCAELLLGYFGNPFRAWIDDLVETETVPTDPTLTDQIETIVWAAFREDYQTITSLDSTFCSGLLTNIPPLFWDELLTLLRETYQDWIVVSYRLNQLIRIFTNLKSIYPASTLHDCDDGSDDNPVRLNNTILGSL